MSERIRSLLRRVATQTGPAPADAELRERLPARPGLASIEQEIAREVAHSLGKAGRLLEEAIEHARTARAAAEASVDRAERAIHVERFHAAREQAERRLRDLLIQREALGWRNHSDIKRAYVIPTMPPDAGGAESE